MEVQEIKLDNLPSTNFGPGVELLMNGGGRKTAVSEINLADITKLEQDLNDLSSSISGGAPMTLNLSSPEPSFFSEPKSDVKQIFTPRQTSFSPSFEEIKEPSTPKTESWDGFKSVNTGNISPEKPSANPAPELSAGDILKNKFNYLRKLEEFERKGISLTRKYTMDSSLSEMQGEYENIVSEKERSNSVKFQGKMLMACITGLEFMNNKFDPFELKLDGWAEQVNENLEDYDDIFAELHDKYKSKAKLAPELKLMFQLGGGAIMLHMTNTMFKSSIPGMDDIMRQNPELMQKFTQAAVNSMAGSNPGFSGFMNTVQQQAPPRREQPPSRYEDTRTVRPNMKGPSSDIDELLSGLKPRSTPMPSSSFSPVTDVGIDDPGSTVSLSELNEMKEGLKPLKSKRRVRSDKNTVSIVI
jgi:hypothetical protein